MPLRPDLRSRLGPNPCSPHVPHWSVTRPALEVKTFSQQRGSSELHVVFCCRLFLFICFCLFLFVCLFCSCFCFLCFFFFFLLFFSFYNCIVPVGFLLWVIRVAFPGDSQLRQSRATQPSVYAGCFSVSIIHRSSRLPFTWWGC